MKNGIDFIDADVVCYTLDSFPPEGRMLVEAGAGDTALSLLTLDSEEMVVFSPDVE